MGIVELINEPVQGPEVAGVGKAHEASDAPGNVTFDEFDGSFDEFFQDEESRGVVG